MSHYTDFVDNFKLASPDEFPAISRRNIKIWNMLLNRLGVPDTLHEPVTAIFVTGNWDHVNGFEQITVMRMARNLTININDQQRVYNRLKKSIPKFFDLQSRQHYQIIAREIVHERAQKYKTKAQYKFLIYEIVHDLFCLPMNTTIAGIHRAIERALAHIPILEAPPERTGKEKDIEQIAREMIRRIEEIEHRAGSMSSAAVHLEFADENGKLRELATLILGEKPR